MKAVILAGGFGSRLSEATNLIPKPMVEIGGKPILWHIMKIYSYYGINEFIISTSALVKCPINFIDIKDTTTPQLIPINISNKYFLNKSNCLYKGTANTIVTGPKKKFILSPPNL